MANVRNHPATQQAKAAIVNGEVRRFPIEDATVKNTTKLTAALRSRVTRAAHRHTDIY